jgi:methanethiol S-methyltransferase
MVMFGFLLQWPTLLTMAMFPVLLAIYVHLARAEEREALADAGAGIREVPGFFPRLGILSGGPRQGHVNQK